MATGGPDGADLLNDWDNVFAIRYSEVDAGIRAAGHTPPNFKHDVPDPDEPFHIEGEFDHWRMGLGSDNHIIILRMPFYDMYYNSPLSGYFKFRSGWFDVQVSLASIMRDGASEDEGQYVDFMVDANKDVKRFAVHLDPPPPEDNDPSGEMQDVFIDWCNAHIDKFKHVFATVNIHRKLPKKDKDFQWLQPTDTRYAAWDDGKDRASGIFGVLCMTDHNPLPKNQDIKPDVIPDGVPSAFVISKKRFLEKFLLGGMGYMFDGPAEADANKQWPDDYFALSQSGTIITNTAPVCIEKLMVGKDDPKPYKATVPTESLTITLNNSTFTVEFNRLIHGYDHLLFADMLRVEHFITSDYVLQLDPETQVIDLCPVPRKIDAKDNEIGNHYTEIFTTEAERTVELVLIVVGLVLSFSLVASECSGWIEVVEQQATEGATSAAVESEMVVISDADVAQINYLASAEAREAGEWIVGREINAGKISSVFNAIARGLVICNSPRLLGEILEKIADGKKTELPSYPDFAARVLKPIKWPAQDTEYKLYGVQINDSFQTYGSWNISDKNPV